MSGKNNLISWFISLYQARKKVSTGKYESFGKKNLIPVEFLLLQADMTLLLSQKNHRFTKNR